MGRFMFGLACKYFMGAIVAGANVMESPKVSMNITQTTSNSEVTLYAFGRALLVLSEMMS